MGEHIELRVLRAGPCKCVSEHVPSEEANESQGCAPPGWRDDTRVWSDIHGGHPMRSPGNSAPLAACPTMPDTGHQYNYSVYQQHRSMPFRLGDSPCELRITLEASGA